MIECPLKMQGLLLRRECESCTGRPTHGQRCLQPKQVLHFEGDEPIGLWGVIEGYLRETRTFEDGRVLGIRLVRPGDLIGVEALMSQTYQCSVESLTHVRLCRVTQEEIAESFTHNPEQGIVFARVLAREVQTLRDGMMILGSMSAEERVLTVLQHLARGERGKWIEIPLSRTQLSELLGLALATVSRTLHRLDEEGVIRLEGRRFQLADT